MTRDLAGILADLPRGRQLATVLRIVADLVESEPVQTSTAIDDDHPRPIRELRETHPWVTAGWARAHVEADGRGPRNTPLYRPSRVEAAAAASPVLPRQTRTTADRPDLEDPFQCKS